MKCWVCKKKVEKKDLMFPVAHVKCVEKLYRTFESLKIIDILGIEGTQIMFKMNDSFDEQLTFTLENYRDHVVSDDTVDEDIITLQGVLKTIQNYVPNNTSKKTLYYCGALIFDSLMKIKYGSPVPDNKRFSNRVKEFFKEVYTIPIDQDIANYFKTLNKYK